MTIATTGAVARRESVRAIAVCRAAPAAQAVLDAEQRGALRPVIEKYDGITFNELLRTQGASPVAVAILAVGLPSGLGAGPDVVSALDLLREAAHRALHKQSLTIR